jgi:hypothetical protein
MQIDELAEKVDVIRRYRTAPGSRQTGAKITEVTDKPFRIELPVDDQIYTFTLTGNELVHLLSEFAVNNIGELFATSMIELPFRVVVHSNEGFDAFAREQGYDEETINDPLRFQSIREVRDGVHWLHVPMWRWEVDKEDLQKHPVTFV